MTEPVIVRCRQRWRGIKIIARKTLRAWLTTVPRTIDAIAPRAVVSAGFWGCRMMIRNLFAAGILSLMTMTSANAAVIFDGFPSPDGHGYGAWVNMASGQNFAVKVDFASAVTIDGFDILINPYMQAGLGNPVALKIFSQDPSHISGLTPDTYFSTIDDIQVYEINDVNLAHADFAPIGLGAGEYWIGMSSANNLDISWASYREPDAVPGRPLTDQLQLAGNNFAYYPGIYNLAFRVDGSFASAVPEPETWVLFILGFGFIGTFMRKAGRHTEPSFARLSRRC